LNNAHYTKLHVCLSNPSHWIRISKVRRIISICMCRFFNHPIQFGPKQRNCILDDDEWCIHGSLQLLCLFQIVYSVAKSDTLYNSHLQPKPEIVSCSWTRDGYLLLHNKTFISKRIDMVLCLVSNCWKRLMDRRRKLEVKLFLLILT
jgi:hypothetical protein